MKVSSEFSKYAKDYSSYNIIQEKVIQKLLLNFSLSPKRILDLGCGNGALVKSIDWEYEYLVGVDFAQGMLDLHPKSDSIECINGDFNDSGLFDTLKSYNFEHIFSASALQWSSSMEEVFKNISKLQTAVSLAVFTSGTFFTLNEVANLEPLLDDAKSIESLAHKYFDVDIELVQYKLAFESVRDMFRYIKKSGVSAGRNILSYKQTKELMNEYPLEYLEFEVIFITSR